jgi:hypothetical protein
MCIKVADDNFSKLVKRGIGKSSQRGQNVRKLQGDCFGGFKGFSNMGGRNRETIKEDLIDNILTLR